jgi:hypothetical protein
MMASSRSTGREGDPGIDETTTASTDSGGSAGGTGTMQRPAGAAPVPQTRLAAAGRAASTSNCFSPTPAQIDYLLGRSSYGPEDAEKWQQVVRVNVVPVDICPSAAAQLQAAIAADNDIGYMQAAVADNELLSAELSPYGPENVLAVEQANEEATVYVY